MPVDVAGDVPRRCACRGHRPAGTAGSGPRSPGPANVPGGRLKRGPRRLTRDPAIRRTLRHRGPACGRPQRASAGAAGARRARPTGVRRPRRRQRPGRGPAVLARGCVGEARPRRCAPPSPPGAVAAPGGDRLRVERPEWGLTPSLRGRLLAGCARAPKVLGRHHARRRPASVQGGPSSTGRRADPATRRARPRLCDLGYLRSAYLKDNGQVGYRCAAEPVAMFVRKGCSANETNQPCVCNSLTGRRGLGQTRPDGRAEEPS